MCRIFDVSNAYKKKKKGVERIGSGGGRWYGHGLQGRALVAGEGWGGCRGWMAVPKKSWSGGQGGKTRRLGCRRRFGRGVGAVAVRVGAWFQRMARVPEAPRP